MCKALLHCFPRGFAHVDEMGILHFDTRSFGQLNHFIQCPQIVRPASKGRIVGGGSGGTSPLMDGEHTAVFRHNTCSTLQLVGCGISVRLVHQSKRSAKSPIGKRTLQNFIALFHFLPCKRPVFIPADTDPNGAVALKRHHIQRRQFGGGITPAGEGGKITLSIPYLK